MNFANSNLPAMGLNSVYGSGLGEKTNTSTTVYVSQTDPVQTPYLAKSASEVLRVDWSCNYRCATAGTAIIVAIDFWWPTTAVSTSQLFRATAPTVNATDGFPASGFLMVSTLIPGQPLLASIKFLSSVNASTVAMSATRLNINKVGLIR
jgi:hypothetical protein